MQPPPEDHRMAKKPKTNNLDLIGEDTPAPTYPAMTLAEFAESIGVPTTAKGHPDLLNHRPNRFVSLDEAKFYKASWYWSGEEICRNFHVGPRRVSNPRICGSCERVADGKPNIYPDSNRMPRTYEMKAAAKDDPVQQLASVLTGAVAGQARAAAPDAADKRFLAALAEHRHVGRAAEAVGSTAALIESRRACDPVFRAAMTELEERLQIPKATMPEPTGFPWTPEIEQKLVTLYVDTGDLQTACDNCGVTRSEYFKHLEGSYTFARAVEEATPRAEQALEDRAVQMSLAGNDRLLVKLLAAKRPDVYGERARIDLSVKGNTMSPEEMDAYFQRLCAQLTKTKNIDWVDDAGNVIDAEVVDGKVVFPQKQLPALPAPTPDSEDDA
jgi:hypothetical protein